jgi:hypothetical protein
VLHPLTDAAMQMMYYSRAQAQRVGFWFPDVLASLFTIATASAMAANQEHKRQQRTRVLHRLATAYPVVRTVCVVAMLTADPPIPCDHGGPSCSGRQPFKWRPSWTVLAECLLTARRVLCSAPLLFVWSLSHFALAYTAR